MILLQCLLLLHVFYSSGALSSPVKLQYADAFTLTERDALQKTPLSCVVVTPHSSQGVLNLTKVARTKGGLGKSRTLKQIFLPAEWPDSVQPEYLSFQILNCLQDACSYLRSVLSTRAILSAMGVGNAEVTATAATLLWFLRDGAGMLGGLIFASMSSLKFGQNAKQWRLFADGINNVGITLEVVAPIFSSRRSMFLICLSIASVCKALCGVAAGATNAAIGEHWGSRRGNFAEVASKNGIQHTLVSLVCLLISVPFIRLTGIVSAKTTWLIYTTLTVTHMYANFAAMRMLSLRSLNFNRLSILIGRFLSLRAAQGTALTTEQEAQQLSSVAVARVDPLLLWSRPPEARQQAGVSIIYWAPLQTLLNLVISPEAIARSVSLYSECGYLVSPSTDGRAVIVCMKESASVAGSEDQVKALFEAHWLRQKLNSRNSIENENAQDVDAFMKRARCDCDAVWSEFWSTLKRLEWDTVRLQLQPSNAVTVNVERLG